MIRENLSGISVVEPELQNDIHVYNPYPALGAPSNPCWPRGFPMDALKNSEDSINLAPVVSPGKFAVLQSLADLEPDVDAVFRLTHKTPFNFKKSECIS